MSALILNIVPVHELDLALFERSVARLEANRTEIDGELFPLDEDLAAGKARLREVKRGLAALTPAQRKASRRATQGELAAAMRRVAAEHGYDCGVPPEGPWDEAGLIKRGKRRVLAWLSVYLMRGASGLNYYLEGDEALLAQLAQALADVAGAQATYIAELSIPAGALALYLPTTKR